MRRDYKGTKRKEHQSSNYNTGKTSRRLNLLNIPTQLTNREGFQIANKHTKRSLNFWIKEM